MRAGDVLRDLGRPVTYHADLARALGSIPAALMLVQLLYWSDKSDDDGWVWKLEADWDEELAFSSAVVKGARTTLVGLGLIEHKRDGLPAKPYYRVDMDALDRWWEATFRRTSPAKIAHQDGRKSPDIPLLTETTAETTNPSRALDFDRFYGYYPRKIAKGAAKKAWDKALKKTSPGIIIDAALRYRDDPNLPDPRTEAQWIPHPSTWLNDERWEDGPLPPRKGRGSNLTPSDRTTDDDPNYWSDK